MYIENIGGQHDTAHHIHISSTLRFPVWFLLLTILEIVLDYF
jgi:hypothetical protein